ncbi:MAG: hypothetical protein ACLR17_21415 [Enterobacteriaceae bacterium]
MGRQSLAAGHHFLAWLQQQAEFRDSARYSAYSVFQTIRTLAGNTTITQRGCQALPLTRPTVHAICRLDSKRHPATQPSNCAKRWMSD